MKQVLILILLGFLIQPVRAEGGLVDNFQSGSLDKWYPFDKAKPIHSIKKNQSPNKKSQYYLNIQGKTKNWYIGGCGIYLAQDMALYDTVKIKVLGFGPDSGILKIAMTQDERKSYQKEMDVSSNALYDTTFVYELAVNWTGWKTVQIPVSQFKVANPGRGSGFWNPTTQDGYKGLLTFELVLAGHKQISSGQVGVDDIELVQGIGQP